MRIPDNPYSDHQLIDFLAQQESQNIDWGSEFEDLIVDRLTHGKSEQGSKLPWMKTHDLIRLRPGEVTIWAGMNGHHKSMLTGQVMMWLAQYERVGIASFEMPIADTTERMIRQAAGTAKPAPEYGRRWARWNHERICYYDQIDTVPADRVLGSMYYMAREMGCKHILIDSLTKCGIPKSEGDLEKRFIDTLAASAKGLDIHIHLVAHVRKPHTGGEEHIPTKFDIRGAGELTDLVDNVMICWKNKRREALRQKQASGRLLSESEQEYFDNNPDHKLICAKQRRGEFEGPIALWFDPNSLQFTGDSTGRTMNFDITRSEQAA